jgi:serine/threonine protein kinase
MECLDGVNLKTYMSRNTLTTARIADLACRSPAHSARRTPRTSSTAISTGQSDRVGNRDREGAGLRTGAAFQDRRHDELGPQGSTMPGRPMGTANYMAPERILQLPLDPRSDLFSLGVVSVRDGHGKAPLCRSLPI